MTKERRAYDRLGAAGEVTLKTADAAAGGWRGCLENISFGGFGMSMQEKIEPESSVDFDLNISTISESLCGKARVRYANEKIKYNNKIFIVGVEFTDVNKDILTYLIKRIQAKIAQQKASKTQGSGASFMPF